MSLNEGMRKTIREKKKKKKLNFKNCHEKAFSDKIQAYVQILATT